MCVRHAVFIQNVRILIRNHLGLRVAGIPLHSLDVTAIELQLVGDAGMPETVKDHLGQVVGGNQLVQRFLNPSAFRGRAEPSRDNQIVISIFIAQRKPHGVHLFFALDEHFRYRSGQKNFANAAGRFRLFQHQRRAVFLRALRENRDDVLVAQRFHAVFADALQFFVDENRSSVPQHRLFGNIHAVPSQTQQLPQTKRTGK